MKLMDIILLISLLDHLVYELLSFDLVYGLLRNHLLFRIQGQGLNI